MRRWLCVIVLVTGFAGQVYAPGSVPNPVPIERPLEANRGGRLERTRAWWQAT
jgi:hypothetical protein